MFINPNLYLAGLLDVVLFGLGFFWARSARLGFPLTALVSLLGGLCVLLFSVNYLHLVDDPVWYIQFRSWSGVEVLSGAAGLGLGMWAAKIENRDYPLILFVFAASLLLTLPPYIKNIVKPVRFHLRDKVEDGVTLQSSPSTCGPSSLASVMRALGVEITESEIARGAYSCGSSTEIWYLLRYANGRGLDFKISEVDGIQQVRPPAIIGTWIGRAGHFITVLDDQNGQYVIGDPLLGRTMLTRDEFERKYRISGLCISFWRRPK